MHDPTRTDPTVDDRTTRQAAPHIGLLLFDGVEELDAVGPWEVLAHWTQQHPEDGWDVSCLSPDGAPVVGAKTLSSAPTTRSTTPPPSTSSSTRAARAPGRCSATPTTWTGSASSAPRSR